MSTVSRIISRWGLIKGLRLYYKIKKDQTEIWHLPELKHPVFLRKGTSDSLIFKQIFGMGEYDIVFPDNPKVIIDGGANIGLFAVLMANRFPEARIFSIEPDTANFEQLKKNTAYYPNITPIHAGIWNKACKLIVVDEGHDEWGLQVKEVDGDHPDSLNAITLTDICEQYGIRNLDIVKLDVEGAEAKIFSEDFEPWLSITQNLIIELHERNWPDVGLNFYKAVAKYPFDSIRQGEYFMYTRRV